MKSKIIALFIAVLLIVTCTNTAFAENIDSGKIGSVSVTLTDQKKNEPIVGAELSLYCVALIETDNNGNLSYSYIKDFAQFENSLGDSSLPADLDAFVPQYKGACVKQTTNEKGTVLFDGLSLGLYFVKQTGNVDGFAPCKSFLVTVPTKQGDGYIYEVDASPKTEVERLVDVTIRKVWNTDESAKASDSVTVQLLQNGNLIETAILNERNNWQITYANMPESDAYSVKEIDIPHGFTATYSQSKYVFTVTNTSTLIQTGQLVWPIPVLAICGMLFITVGTSLMQKKRKPNA